jgi:hypothetical protein
MIYAVEIGSGAMICTKFHRDWLRHSKIDRGIYRHTESKVIS